MNVDTETNGSSCVYDIHVIYPVIFVENQEKRRARRLAQIVLRRSLKNVMIKIKRGSTQVKTLQRRQRLRFWRVCDGSPIRELMTPADA